MSTAYPKITCQLLQMLGLSAESAGIVTAELERLSALSAHQKTQLDLWHAVETHVQGHSEAIPGQLYAQTALAWLKERDALKSQRAAFEKATGMDQNQRVCDRSCRPAKQ